MKQVFLFIFSISILNAQIPEWIIYNTSNSPLPSNNVFAIEVDIYNNVWFACEGGLAKFDRLNWEVFTPGGSAIPFNLNYVIDSDRDGNIWFMGQTATNAGLVKYDGINWKVYNSSNSPLPSDFIKAIAVDSNNTKWFLSTILSTGNKYLISFDGDSSWTTYPGYYNNNLFGEYIEVDKDGNLWTVERYILARFYNQNYTFIQFDFGEYPSSIKSDGRNLWIASGGAGWGGLFKYDLSNFYYYPYLAVTLEVDEQNNLWMGTEGIVSGTSGYIGKFADQNWTFFNPANSPLPVNQSIWDIEFDHYGNLWISLAPTQTGEGGGIAVYREGGVIIPVELISFNAVIEGNNVELKWLTATEINNMGFELERSIDMNNWKQISFINGHGTTSEYKNYSFSDKELTAGKYYYRLKQIDNDGSFEYSNIVEAEITSPLEFILYQNYPNPFNPATTIKFSIPAAEFVSLKIYDMLGRELKTLTGQMYESGSHEVVFNAEGISSGIYYYRLNAGVFTDIKKLQILK